MNKQQEKSENRSKKSADNSAPDSIPSSKGKEISTEQPEASAEVLKKADKLAVLSISEAIFRGPLPSPEMLRRYGEAVPGSVERIMNIAETGIASFQSERKIGQYGGIIIACLAVVGACFTAFFSDSWYVSVSAVLIAALGIGGPTVAQALVERFPRRNGKNED